MILFGLRFSPLLVMRKTEEGDLWKVKQRCPIVPVCGLTSIKATILDQGLANVQVRNDVTMHGHILAYHKPAKRKALLPTGQISGLVCGLHNGLFYTYGVLAQNNKKYRSFWGKSYPSSVQDILGVGFPEAEHLRLTRGPGCTVWSIKE